MIREIRKAKLTNGNTLEVSLIEHHPDKTEREVTIKCQQLVHNDLMVAFSRLTFHLASICQLHDVQGITPDEFDPTTQLQAFKVTSFSVGGHDEHEGVSITGQKELEGGKILNLNSPFQKYEDEMAPYDYASELAAEIHACISEVEQYMFEGKYAVKQLELDFVGDNVNNATNDESGIASVTIKDSNSPRKKGKRIKLEIEKIVEMGEVATY